MKNKPIINKEFDKYALTIEETSYQKLKDQIESKDKEIYHKKQHLRGLLEELDRERHNISIDKEFTKYMRISAKIEMLAYVVGYIESL